MKEFISYLSSAVLGETMGSGAKESKASKLTAIPGVGAATAKKLIDAKIGYSFQGSNRWSGQISKGRYTSSISKESSISG